MRLTRHHILALLAGGDAAWWQRLSARRNPQPEDPAVEEEFRRIREQLPEFRDLPPYFAWDSLSAEMKGNILLGVEAGEVVRSRPSGRAIGWRAGFALAVLTLLMLVGYWGQLPVHVHDSDSGPQTPLLQATPGQLAARHRDAGFSVLFHESGASLELSGAVGGVRADFVDEETGQLTVAHVYLD